MFNKLVNNKMNNLLVILKGHLKKIGDKIKIEMMNKSLIKIHVHIV